MNLLSLNSFVVGNRLDLEIQVIQGGGCWSGKRGLWIVESSSAHSQGARKGARGRHSSREGVPGGKWARRRVKAAQMNAIRPLSAFMQTL